MCYRSAGQADKVDHDRTPQSDLDLQYYHLQVKLCRSIWSNYSRFQHGFIWAATWESVPSASCVQRRLVIVFIVHIKKLSIIDYPKCAQWRFWLDCAFAQSDQNLHWAHMSEGTYLTLKLILCRDTRNCYGAKNIIWFWKNPTSWSTLWHAQSADF